MGPIVRGILILSLIGLGGCQKARMNNPQEITGNPAKSSIESCSISEEKSDSDHIALITCPDGSSFRIPKAKDGENGQDGANGSSCTVQSDAGGALITCQDGSQAYVKNGSDGHSCSVQSIDAFSALLTCTDGSQSLMDVSSLTQYSVMEVLDPCGDDPNNYDEVVIRFSSGDLLAYFENGSRRFLTLLTPGTYQTTDAQQCKFKVDSAGFVTDL